MINENSKVVKNTKELRVKLIKAHYYKLPTDLTEDLLTEEMVIDAANHHNIPPKGSERRLRYKVGATKEGNLYKLWDFYAGQINKSLGYQYFSPIIRPYKKEIWQDTVSGDARLVYNYKNAKPKNYVDDSVVVAKPKLISDTIPRKIKTEIYHQHNGGNWELVSKNTTIDSTHSIILIKRVKK